MKQTFGLVRRPWGVFYLKNKITGEQTSLKTFNKQEAQRLLNARKGVSLHSYRYAWAERALKCGYRLYAGTNSRSYFLVNNVAGRLNTSNAMTVPFPAFWYFAVTATNSAGLESDYSGEVVHAVLPVAPEIHAEPYVRLTPHVEHSTNLAQWAPIPTEPPLVPATNAQEFFRTAGLEIERVRLVR